MPLSNLQQVLDPRNKRVVDVMMVKCPSASGNPRRHAMPQAGSPYCLPQ
jgi:hypothetical protein